MPIDHVKLPAADIDASRAFYAAALAPFGYRLVWDEEPTLGAPGERPYGRYYYAAFVLDRDGHDVGAVCHRRPG